MALRNFLRRNRRKLIICLTPLLLLPLPLVVNTQVGNVFFSADISNVLDIDIFGDRIISYSPPPFFSKIQYVSSVITVNSEVKIVNI